MINFYNYMETYGPTPIVPGFDDEFVNETQIDSLYDKAKTSVNIVRLFDKQFPKKQKYLNNISTIADLASGAYGVYISHENRKLIPSKLREIIRFKFGDEFVRNHGIENTPTAIIKKYFPDIKDEDLKLGNTIHVNVRRIIKELGNTVRAVLEISKTIIHESQHSMEREYLGFTTEPSAYLAERRFEEWFWKNKNLIFNTFPILKNLKP